MNTKKKMILAIAMLSYFLTALNNSIIITGITKIAEEFSASQREMSWVQNAYLLAFGGFILLGGRLSDIYGRRRVLNLSLILLGLSAALAGWAPNVAVLIGARAAEGVGAAVLAPVSLALLMDTFEGKERVRAISWYSSVSGLGSCIGLVLGGFFAMMLTWRIGFYLDLPLTGLMLFLSMRALSKGKSVPSVPDIKGTLLSVTGISAFVYAINGAEDKMPWFLAAALLLWLFVKTEKKAAMPVLPLILFQNRIRRKAYAARTAFACATFGFWFFISEYLQLVLHETPLTASFAFLPMTLSTFMAAVAVPGLTQSLGEKKVLLLGTLCLMGGFGGSMLLGEESTFLGTILPVMLLMGLGQGLAMSPMTNLGIFGAGSSFAGAASGMVNASHQIGGSIGLSLMVFLTEDMESHLMIFHYAMAAGILFIAAMLAVSLSFPANLHDAEKREDTSGGIEDDHC